jgi:hypothetical protein
MNLIDWILNIACVFLWIDWRSGRTARPQSVLSLASTVRPADRAGSRGIGSLAALCVILLVRPMFYYAIGPALNWTATTNFLAIAIPWRSDILSRMFLYSTISFLVALGFYYSWLLLLAAVNRRTPSTDEDPMYRFVRGQLGWLDKLPWWLKLLSPSLVAALAWVVFSFILVGLELVPEPTSASRRSQAGAFALAALLTWRWLVIFVFLVHLLNLYVYLGTHPLWQYLSNTGRKLLYPLSFLRFGKIDLSPVLGAAAVFAIAELLLKPLVIDLFQRHIV